MRIFVQFLHLTSRFLAICAMLAGLVAGFLEAVVGATIICVDSCPPRDAYFSDLGPIAVRIMTPCVVLAVLALVAFVAYCLATRQARRVVMPILFLLVGGVIGVAALDALLQHGQATVGTDQGFLLSAPAQAWAGLWGLSLTLVAGAWSGVLARLQWRR